MKLLNDFLMMFWPGSVTSRHISMKLPLTYASSFISGHNRCDANMISVHLQLMGL